MPEPDIMTDAEIAAMPRCETCGWAIVVADEAMGLCNHPEQGMPRAIYVATGTCLAHTALKAGT